MSAPAFTAEALLRDADVLLSRRECRAALTAYDRAEEAGADADRCAGGRWQADMLLGSYEQAWQESDAIRSRGAPDVHRFWQGEPIDGKRVMLRCLRGYGDTIMYLRWLPELMRRCSEVTVQACPRIAELVRCMPHATRVLSWCAEGESDRELWDVQVESAELPYLFRATTATLPTPIPLRFPEATLHRIRMRLGQRFRPRIGLVWTGSGFDPERSVPFASLRPLLRNRAVEFWSLQASANNVDWLAFCAERGWGERIVEGQVTDASGRSENGIAAMAAFASHMDVLITADTMAAHVGGSLGLPTWVLLKWDADWRWMLDREDSPWYPTVRLFRQKAVGDWGEPVTRVCDALRDISEESKA